MPWLSKECNENTPATFDLGPRNHMLGHNALLEYLLQRKRALPPCPALADVQTAKHGASCCSQNSVCRERRRLKNINSTDYWSELEGCPYPTWAGLAGGRIQQALAREGLQGPLRPGSGLPVRRQKTAGKSKCCKLFYFASQLINYQIKNTNEW